MEIEVPIKLSPLEAHGCNFISQSGQQLVAEYCPFVDCGAANKFYADTATGQYKCMRCGAVGNVITFMTRYVEEGQGRTSFQDLQKLGENRGLPVRALRRRKVFFDGEFYLIPSRATSGKVHDIRRHRLGTKMLGSTKGCKTQLFGVDRLSEVAKSAHIFLCEGEWDAMAMDEILFTAKVKGHCVLAVPGADTFKKEWYDLFSKRDVYILYDNDEAGERGSAKVWRLLEKKAKSLHRLEWPADMPIGYDVRDFFISCRKEGVSPQTIYRRLLELCVDKEPQALADEKAEAEADPEFEVVDAKERPSFADLVQLAGEVGIEMDQEMQDGLAYALATVVSTQMSGSPLWTWLVSAPGGGKSVILNMLRDSDRCIMKSSINTKTLVSGFRAPEGEDPSLLAQCHQKTIGVMDATELLAQHDQEFGEMMGLLRSAYDGFYAKGYGNNVQRSYQKLHFSMVLGVTPKIYTYERASLGERFVKLYMRPANREEIEMNRIITAVQAVEQNRDQKPMREAVRKFLAVEVSQFPKVPVDMIKAITALCMLVARLRSELERNPKWNMEEDVMVRPDPEWATRLTLQLCKLASSLAFVYGQTTIDARVYRLVSKVAMDSCRSYNADVVEALAGGGWAKLSRLATQLEVSPRTMDRVAADLRVLGVVEIASRPQDDNQPGRQFIRWIRLSQRISQLHQQAKQLQAEVAAAAPQKGGCRVRLRR